MQEFYFILFYRKWANRFSAQNPDSQKPLRHQQPTYLILY